MAQVTNQLEREMNQDPVRFTKSRPELMIAEDDDGIRFALAELFAYDGFNVTCVADGELLVQYLEQSCYRRTIPEVLILDHRMPGYCGLDVLRAIRELKWQTRVAFVTAFGDDVCRAARGLGAEAVFEKPFDADELRTVIHSWVGHRKSGSRGGWYSIQSIDSEISAACQHAGTVLLSSCIAEGLAYRQPPRDRMESSTASAELPYLEIDIGSED